MSEKEREAVSGTIRLLFVLLEREEKMGRKGDTETANWIRQTNIKLMRAFDEHQEAPAKADRPQTDPGPNRSRPFQQAASQAQERRRRDPRLYRSSGQSLLGREMKLSLLSESWGEK